METSEQKFNGYFYVSFFLTESKIFIFFLIFACLLRKKGTKMTIHPVYAWFVLDSCWIRVCLWYYFHFTIDWCYYFAHYVLVYVKTPYSFIRTFGSYTHTIVYIAIMYITNHVDTGACKPMTQSHFHITIRVWVWVKLSVSANPHIYMMIMVDMLRNGKNL